MGLVQLPHELQLLIFGYLSNDYASLCALVLVSKHLFDCTLELLRRCRTFDLSSGYTDEIEYVMISMYALAVSQGTYDCTTPSLRDNVVRQAFRYTTRKLNFDDRYGFTCEEHIEPENMVKLEKMWKALAGNDRYDVQTWRLKIKGRCADTSILTVLRTMRHLTTLELSASTTVLHWRTQGILEHLQTLKFNAVTNNRLSRVCCHLATKPQLVTLEFAKMIITRSFFEHLKHPLSITSLQFVNCWISPPAMRRIISQCQSLQTFVYTIDVSNWPADATSRDDHHLYRLLADLQPNAHTLKHLTLVMPNVPNYAGQCHLVVSYRILAPHQWACYVGMHNAWQMHQNLTAFDILSKLAPSLKQLHLHRGDELPVLQTLSGIVNSLGPNLLPNLRFVEVTLARLSVYSHFRAQSLREKAIVEKFERRGVECKIWRPQFLFGSGGICRPS